MNKALPITALAGAVLTAHCSASAPPDAGANPGTTVSPTNPAGSSSGGGSSGGKTSSSSGGVSSGSSGSGSSSGSSGSSSSGGHSSSSSGASSSSSSSSGSSSGGASDASADATSPSDSGGDTGGGPGVLGPAPTADSASTQGPYMVQMYTSGVPSDQDYVTPTIYYPTGATAPYPGVVVIPGFTESQGALSQWGTFLASHGFVVMMVDTASGGVANTGVQPPQRELGLMEAVTNLIAENTRMGSPLAGQIDTSRMAIMGHSMGGGGTLLAANDHSSQLKAAVGLNPWNPGGTYPMDTTPTLVFDGTADTLVPPSQGKPEYDSIPTTTPKVYAEFNGGSHFVALTPLGGAATDVVVARFGLSWLEVHEVGDTRYQQFIMNDPTLSAFDSKP